MIKPVVTSPMTKNTLRMLTKHGLQLCRDAHRLSCQGEGPSTIGIYLGVHFKTADALINAGREIAKLESSCV